MKLAVIILNWNDAESTVDCFTSVLAATRSQEQVDTFITIVDNGSTVPELRALKAALAEIQLTEKSRYQHNLLSLESNLGFSAGMNAGIRHSRSGNADFYWLLNNDTVVDSKSIGQLAGLFTETPKLMLAGATIADAATGRVAAAGGHRYFRWLGINRPHYRGKTIAAAQAAGPPGRLDYIDGAALCIRGAFMRRIGGLSEDYYLYYEELDLMAQLAPGERAAWCPGAIVRHQGGGSATTAALRARGAYHAAFSALTYTRKHHPACLPTVILCRLAGLLTRSLLSLQPGLALAALAAVSDNLRGRDARYRERSAREGKK